MTRFLFLLAMAFLAAPLHASGDTIDGCVKQTNGKLRIVGTPGQCTSKETPISWESEGPPGLQGPEGPQGPPGESAPAASSFVLVGFSTGTHIAPLANEGC